MNKTKSSSELVDRYLQAVRFWLPKSRRQEDLLAELGDDLRSQMEDKETELGRPLDETEAAAILKRCGSPMTVAGSLGEKRHLIGPALYPVYIFVMKMVLVWIQIPVFLFIVGPVNVAHSNHWGTAVAETIGNLWTAMLLAAGIITLVFAILERTHAVAGVVCKFDPLKLPPVRKQERKTSLSQTVCQLAFAVFGLVWLLLLPQYPVLILGPAAAFLKAAPTMHAVYLPVVLLGVMAILRPAITLARPQWEWFPPLAEALQAVFSLVLVNFLIMVAVQTSGDWHPFLVLADSVTSAQQFVRVAAIVNVSILISLYCMWLGFCIALLFHIWQLLKYLRRRFLAVKSTASLQMQ